MYYVISLISDSSKNHHITTFPLAGCGKNCTCTKNPCLVSPWCCWHRQGQHSPHPPSGWGQPGDLLREAIFHLKHLKHQHCLASLQLDDRAFQSPVATRKAPTRFFSVGAARCCNFKQVTREGFTVSTCQGVTAWGFSVSWQKSGWELFDVSLFRKLCMRTFFLLRKKTCSDYPSQSSNKNHLLLLYHLPILLNRHPI